MPHYSSGDLRWRNFAFFLFTRRARQLATSGGPIFRCTTKDRGERRASSSQAPHPSFCLSGQKLSRSTVPGGNPLGGLLLSPPNPLRWVLAGPLLAAPWIPGVMFWAILTCFVRNGAFDAIKSRTACSALLPCALRAAPRRRGFSIAVGSALGVRCLER